MKIFGQLGIMSVVPIFLAACSILPSNVETSQKVASSEISTETLIAKGVDLDTACLSVESEIKRLDRLLALAVDDIENGTSTEYLVSDFLAASDSISLLSEQVIDDGLSKALLRWGSATRGLAIYFSDPSNQDTSLIQDQELALIEIEFWCPLGD